MNFMKIAVFSPYLETKGGGERYILTVASIFAKSHQVDLLLPTHLHNLKPVDYKKEITGRLGVDLSEVNFIHAPIGQGSKAMDRYLFLKRYKMLFAVTDGSIFFASSKRNILHIQTPLEVHPTDSMWGNLKVKSWNEVVYNSQFTKDHSKKYWPLPSKVIYPPVSTNHLKPLKKKQIILTVGRFFGFLREKKHQLMIDTFIKMCDEGLVKNWQFHLAGSMGEGDIAYVEELKSKTAGYPIVFHPNIPYEDLGFLYGQSDIYWHAMGFGESDPTKMEHFGITTVEAMASGAVPVVVKKGGQTEIVEEGKSGLFWETEAQLKEMTALLINDHNKRAKLAEGAIERAQFFSEEKFRENILALLHE